jgi:4-hydroxybenzoate polyprenyltransferase
MNCLESYLNSTSLLSEKPAIVFFNGLESLKNKKTSTSFLELHQNAIKAQKFLAGNGLQKHDVLLLFEQPTPDLYAVILGALGLGIKLMIVEPWMKAKALNSVLEKIKPKAVLTNHLGRVVLARAANGRKIPIRLRSEQLHQIEIDQAQTFVVEEMDQNDHAILTFTTGTSGAPKGVHRKHQYLIDQREVLRKYIDYDKHQKMDLTVFTNLVLLNITLGKGSLVIPSSWDEKVLKQLDQLPEKYSVDTLATGPGFLKKLVKHTQKLNLKSFHLGGALADVPIYEEAMDKWPNAHFTHVYGSTEAEPVAVSDLRVAVKKSKEQGHFQTLYLGQPIKEIKTKVLDEVLWVSGKHVSPLYDNDPIANAKNKMVDDEGRVWHCMGDRISIKDDGLWYSGRDSQNNGQFELEQKVYAYVKKSKSFIKTEKDYNVLYGENLVERKKELIERFPQIKDVKDLKIKRDPRHRARIDRPKSVNSSMKNIGIFIKQRVPVVANIILVLGMLFSCIQVVGAGVSILPGFLIGLSLLLFIVELRFMDELKDYEKDKIAHPDRPLPSGLVTVEQVNRLVNWTFGALIGLSIISTFVFSGLSGGLLGLSVLWLYLMYKEFFLGDRLGQYPLIYAITHQIVLVPITLFVVSAIAPELTFTAGPIGFCLIILGSFFSFEVGRKMDPNAHRVLGTYLGHYGKIKTNLLIVLLLGLCVWGGHSLGRLWWFLIPSILVVLTQIKIYLKPEKFKDLEGMVALNLIYNIWILAILGFF